MPRYRLTIEHSRPSRQRVVVHTEAIRVEAANRDEAMGYVNDVPTPVEADLTRVTKIEPLDPEEVMARAFFDEVGTNGEGYMRGHRVDFRAVTNYIASQWRLAGTAGGTTEWAKNARHATTCFIAMLREELPDGETCDFWEARS